MATTNLILLEEVEEVDTRDERVEAEGNPDVGEPAVEDGAQPEAEVQLPARDELAGGLGVVDHEEHKREEGAEEAHDDRGSGFFLEEVEDVPEGLPDFVGSEEGAAEMLGNGAHCRTP